MAIKKIDNITVDGKNMAWGGYIYSLNYEIGFGESPSEVVVEVVNKSGVYDIKKTDLRTTGAPVLIQIGKKIKFYGYPMDYQIDESPSGKTLRISYWDESISYLDKKVVKLKTRALENEVYQNTIIVGSERVNNIPVSLSMSNSIISYSVGATFILKSPLDLKVTDVDYTFPELLAKINSFIEKIPVLDSASSSYRRDYSGKLRDVLSAWCNDLGLGFYWENRKINFIDLKNPANLTSVEAVVASIKAKNNIQSTNSSYSIKDTFTKATEVFFGKDGEIIPEAPEDKTAKTYTFNNIKMKSLPGINPQFYSKNGIWQGEEETVFLNRVRSAYYGVNAFLINLLTDKPVNSSVLYKFCATQEVTSDTALIQRVSNNTSYYDRRQDCKWWKVTLNPNEKTDFEQIYNMYASFAKFFGRFFYFKLPTLQRARMLFGQEGRYYDEWTPLTDVDIFGDDVANVSKYIEKYDELTLRGWITQSGETISKAPSGSFDAPRQGYLIINKDPKWEPEDNNFELSLGDYYIIEGADGNNDFSATTTVNGNPVRVPSFYVGKVDKGATPVTKSIVMPSLNPLRLSATMGAGGLGLAELVKDRTTKRIQYTSYNPPETANVNFYDFSSQGLSEEQVLGASAFYYNNLSLTKNNFTKAANDLILSVNKSQKDAFYSELVLVPNIDLVEDNLSIGKGLLSVSVSFSSNGIQTSYKFGTEKMRLRNSDVFYKYYYNAAKRKIELNEVDNATIRLGARAKK
jgi:hypothetical protein